MKLNPLKCSFEFSSDKFLGFIVNARRIEDNPKKIQALLDMKFPTKTKADQSLTCRIAALSKFISRSTDKCVPFFNILRGNKQFEWTEECERAFQELKMKFAKPLVLSKPLDGEELGIYQAITEHAASNNEAEYDALIADLRLAQETKAGHIEICSDSQLVVNHVSREYEARGEKMISYPSKIHDLLAQFKSYALKQIPSEENTTIDALARLASSNMNDKENLIPIQFLEKPSITSTEEVDMMDTSPNLMTPIAGYLNTGELPDNKNKAQKIRRKAA
ncbi:hypothetical protein CsatB_017626 [Cannabis sativa]|uniref:uncharacterized protein LOC133036195 n=1 Tax=Cannabis sativa TaxID=3483 RepID=UPI0029CA74EE|nr:uncharacterized protein LOC133036195 [Cannabis sativa]